METSIGKVVVIWWRIDYPLVRRW